jgi:toxin ParE1/3/4
MKVEFTDPAEESLRKIYCSYPDDVAEKIIEKILLKAETLSNLANRGRIVEELRPYNQNHRYIIEGNYKIIYIQKADIVYITDIFNMKLDPGKIHQKHQK